MTRIAEALGAVLEDRDRRRDTVRRARIEGRNTDGTLQLLRLDGECVSRGCATGGYTGQTVRTARVFCAADVGTSGAAAASIRGFGSFLWVESLTPSVLEAGTTPTVTVKGYGFKETTEFEFVLADRSPNPEITITDKRLIDSETYELDLDVDAAHAPLTDAPLAYDNPGDRP